MSLGQGDFAPGAYGTATDPGGAVADTTLRPNTAPIPGAPVTDTSQGVADNPFVKLYGRAAHTVPGPEPSWAKAIHDSSRPQDDISRRIQLIRQEAPTLLSNMDMAMQLAAAPTSDDQMLDQTRSTMGYAITVQEGQALARMSMGDQRDAWDRMTPDRQAAFRATGYDPTVPQVKTMGPAGAGLGGIVTRVGHGVAKAWDVTGADSVSGLAGTALEKATGLGGLARPAAEVRHLYRAAAYVVGYNHSFAGAWNQTSNGERYFVPSSIRDAADALGDGPEAESALYLAQRVAGGSTLESTLKEAGIAPGTPEYSDRFKALTELFGSKEFTGAVNALQAGKVSPGRDAVKILRIHDPDLQRIVGGMIDGTVSFYGDPLVIGGKVLEGYKVAKYGITFATAETDVTKFGLAAHQLEALDDATRAGESGRRALLAAKRYSDYLQAVRAIDWRAVTGMRTSGPAALATMISDVYATQGPKDLNFLARYDKRLGKILHPLSDYDLELASSHWGAAGIGPGITAPSDVANFMIRGQGLAEMSAGRWGNFTRTGISMPHMTPFQSRLFAAKINMGSVLEIMNHDLPEELQNVFDARVADVLKKVPGRGLSQTQEMSRALITPAVQPKPFYLEATRRLLQPVTKTIEKMITLLPSTSAIQLGGDMSYESLDRLLSMTYGADTRGDIINRYFNLHNLGERRFVFNTQILPKFFADIGALDTQAGRDLLDTYVRGARQAYAEGGLDLIGTGLSAHPAGLMEGDEAWATAIPEHKELMEAAGGARKLSLQHALFGSAPSSWGEAFLSKFWKPSVLMRLGFITRVGGEEALGAAARLGGWFLPGRWAGSVAMQPTDYLLKPYRVAGDVLRWHMGDDALAALARGDEGAGFMNQARYGLSKAIERNGRWITPYVRNVATGVQAGFALLHDMPFTGPSEALGRRLGGGAEAVLHHGGLDERLAAARETIRANQESSAAASLARRIQGAGRVKDEVTGQELVNIPPDELKERFRLAGTLSRDPSMQDAFARALGGNWERVSSSHANLMTVGSEPALTVAERGPDGDIQQVKMVIDYGAGRVSIKRGRDAYFDNVLNQQIARIGGSDVSMAMGKAAALHVPQPMADKLAESLAVHLPEGHDAGTGHDMARNLRELFSDPDQYRLRNAYHDFMADPTDQARFETLEALLKDRGTYAKYTKAEREANKALGGAYAAALKDTSIPYPTMHAVGLDVRDARAGLGVVDDPQRLAERLNEATAQRAQLPDIPPPVGTAGAAYDDLLDQLARIPMTEGGEAGEHTASQKAAITASVDFLRRSALNEQESQILDYINASNRSGWGISDASLEQLQDIGARYRDRYDLGEGPPRLGPNMETGRTFAMGIRPETVERGGPAMSTESMGNYAASVYGVDIMADRPRGIYRYDLGENRTLFTEHGPDGGPPRGYVLVMNPQNAGMSIAEIEARYGMDAGDQIPELWTYTNPEARLQGVNRRLYAEAEHQGFLVEDISGAYGSLTGEGAKARVGRLRRKIAENGYAWDLARRLENGEDGVRDEAMTKAGLLRLGRADKAEFRNLSERNVRTSGGAEPVAPIARNHVRLHGVMVNPETADVLANTDRTQVLSHISDPAVSGLVGTMLDAHATVPVTAASMAADRAQIGRAANVAFSPILTENPELAQRVANALGESIKGLDLQGTAGLAPSVGQVDLHRKVLPDFADTIGGHEGVYQAHAPLLYHLTPTPDVGYGQLMEDWIGKLQAHLKTRLTSAQDGRILHEVVGPLASGRWDMAHGVRVSSLDLPSEILGAQYYKPKEGIWTKMVRWGFQKVLGPGIDSMIREPMFAEHYMIARKALAGIEDRLADTKLIDQAHGILARAGVDPEQIRNTFWDLSQEALNRDGPRSWLNPDVGSLRQHLPPELAGEPDWRLAQMHRKLLEDVGSGKGLTGDDAAVYNILPDELKNPGRRLNGGDVADLRAALAGAGEAHAANRAEFVAQYRRIEERTLAAEKAGTMADYTGRERQALKDGDWRTFSVLRGYSPAEIRDFEWWMEMNAGTGGAKLDFATRPYPPGSPNAGAEAQTLADPGQIFDARYGKGPDEALAGVSNHDLATLRMWHNHLDALEGIAHQSATDRAMEMTIPFIHDHHVRSQFSDWVRHFMPFQFAEEQFIKRWARTMAFRPDALVRGQLLLGGLRKSGVVQKDQYGDDVLTIPGSAAATSMMSRALQTFTGKDFTIPLSIPLAGSVTNSIPGAHFEVQPGGTPLVSVPLRMMTQRFPELIPVQNAVSGEQAANRSVMEMIVPKSVYGLWQAKTADPEHDKHLSQAAIMAMTMMMANDARYAREHTDPDGTVHHLVPGIADDATTTADEQEQFVQRVTRWARTLDLVRTLFGFASPAQPVPKWEGDLHPYLVQLLQAMPDQPEAAFSEFQAQYPDATAFEVFSSETKSGMPLPSTQAVGKYLEDNKDFVQRYPLASSVMAPPPSSADEPSKAAYREQLAFGLRVNKSPKEWYADAIFAQGAPGYFDAKKAHDAWRAANPNDTRGRQVEAAAWKDFTTQYFAAHPLFHEELVSGDAANRRLRVMDEMRLALNDPDVPVSPQVDDLKALLESTSRMQVALNQLGTGRTNAVNRMRTNIKVGYQRWVDAFIAAHPGVEMFYLRNIEPDLSLPDNSEDQVVG